MKIVIFTSNAMRHKYIANTLAQHVSECLVVSECKPYDGSREEESKLTLIEEHFALRVKTEENFFGGHNTFLAQTLPILYKEVNLPFVYETVKKYSPDVAFVYGSWIIKEPLLSLIPSGRFVNLHLGLSPYYRGAGTNFWPFANNELEYVGSTLLHIDAGIDTGDIITHVRPVFEKGDTVHTVGCKIIKESGKVLVKLLENIRNGEELPRVSQWEESNVRLYKIKDFNEKALQNYHKNLKEGMIENYINSSQKKIKLISL